MCVCTYLSIYLSLSLSLYIYIYIYIYTYLHHIYQWVLQFSWARNQELSASEGHEVEIGHSEGGMIRLEALLELKCLNSSLSSLSSQ